MLTLNQKAELLPEAANPPVNKPEGRVLVDREMRVRPNDEVNRPGRRRGGRRRSVIRPKGGYLQIVPAGSELNGVLGEIAGGTRGTKAELCAKTDPGRGWEPHC